MAKYEISLSTSVQLISHCNLATEWHSRQSTKTGNLPGAKYTPASNCCVNVAEPIITDRSPLTVVVDFQTSFVRQSTACQSNRGSRRHCQWQLHAI